MVGCENHRGRTARVASWGLPMAGAQMSGIGWPRRTPRPQEQPGEGVCGQATFWFIKVPYKG